MGRPNLFRRSDWKYINVRRLSIYIEETIGRGTGWAVFEPNDPLLWTRVSGTITAFLRTLWRDGVLMGASEGEAFFVNIGKGGSMTDDDIQNGKLICVIGLAPVRRSLSFSASSIPRKQPPEKGRYIMSNTD